jgi:hypothetical protein
MASANGGRSVPPEGAHIPSIELRKEHETDIGIVSQTSRSGYLMYPYLISVYGLGAGE